MAEHHIKVVDDNTLATGDGWAIARHEATGDLYFVVERSAAADEEVLSNAWKAAANLVLEEAVREGHVKRIEPGEGDA